MYGLITDFIYYQDIENVGYLVTLFITPFILSGVGAVAAWRMAKYVSIMSKQPLAPEGTKTSRTILWISVFTWAILWLVFLVAIFTSIDQNSEDGDGFPLGMLTTFPVYMGLCLAIYTTGTAYSAWSRNNKLETLLIIGLAWAAFAMFLLLPAVISSWNLGAENPDVNWDSVIWWLRFGSLFPAIAPWLIVVGLYFIHNRSIEILEEDIQVDGGPPLNVAMNGSTAADACPTCGGKLSVHPKTQEVFCAACGYGLSPEQEASVVVDATPAPTHSEDMFVEQTPSPVPAVVATPIDAPPETNFCTNCGGKLPAKAEQLFCEACGTRIPGRGQQSVPQGQAPQPRPATPPVPPPAPTHAQPPTAAAPTAAAPVTTFSPAPTIPRAPTPTSTLTPAQTPAQAKAPAPVQQPNISDKCPLCGSPVAIHPRTGERFCPACGAGLRTEQ
jgi:uncharacterized Zn finger protein (UPF0148 family)